MNNKIGRMLAALISILAVTLTLAGCAAHQVDYESVAAPPHPMQFIEKALLEQPSRFRAGYAHATSEYVEFSRGAVSREDAISPDKTATVTYTRLYYKSIAQMRLLSKRRWWIVEVLDAQGKRLAEIWSDSKDQATRLIAALDAMSHKTP